jgi:formate dehydrogenase major subunit
MEVSGIPSTRWFDATLLPSDQVDQRDNIKAMFVMGHGGNTIPRVPGAVEGLGKLEMLVVVDPHPTNFVSLGNRKDGTYVLPACTNFECDGSRTASNRSVQWGEKIVEPIFESANDYWIIYRFAQKLGFAAEMFKNIKLVKGKFGDEPEAESLLREINRGGWSSGYTGQSPERLKAHMANQDKFDIVTLRASKDTADVGGDYYGLPWPCWGKPEVRHPGTHILYNTNLRMMDGGGAFRPRFGVERNGETLLAQNSWNLDSPIQDGYPEFTYAIFQRLGWDADLTPEEKATIPVR